MTSRINRLLLPLIGAALLVGCKLGTYAEARSDRMVEIEQAWPDRMTLAMSRFLFDDLGGLNTDTLETNAMPWKVVATAMLMESAAREGTPLDAKALPGLFQRNGWINATGIDNWSTEAQPVFDKPVGLVSGYIDKRIPRIRLEVANMGCAACHAGMSYDSRGKPTGRVWLGAPNTSRDLDGYLGSILASLNYVKNRPAELMATIPKIFPGVDAVEIETIRKYVVPQITKRMNDPNEILVAFDHGGVGSTNGVAALKMRLKARPDLVAVQGEHGYTSIPDISDRALRTSLLYDGLYALQADARFVERAAGQTDARDADRLASIVAFFLVPTMGIKPDASEKQARPVREILDFVQAYRPQPFPGPVDAARAERGSSIYAAKCASCHGSYSAGIDKPRLQSFPNRLVPQHRIGSDPARWQAITDETVRALNRTPVARKLNAANARGYVAPILNGIWASAPYMHNGSVPTLWHFMHPSERPGRFEVGGHALDFQRVGIAYPMGYQPWSTPVPYDTAGPGRSNQGHEREFEDMSEAQKDALLEYLKLL
ncbi:c-type cytochrome [Hylemonella sp. W303a]|uniref:c-type cytochrome n=1 Tax=Hylemonella sp. W303a TaxID=3389873 RepID=UPI00396AF546